MSVRQMKDFLFISENLLFWKVLIIKHCILPESLCLKQTAQSSIGKISGRLFAKIDTFQSAAAGQILFCHRLDQCCLIWWGPFLLEALPGDDGLSANFLIRFVCRGRTKHAKRPVVKRQILKEGSRQSTAYFKSRLPHFFLRTRSSWRQHQKSAVIILRQFVWFHMSFFHNGPKIAQKLVYI